MRRADRPTSPTTTACCTSTSSTPSPTCPRPTSRSCPGGFVTRKLAAPGDPHRRVDPQRAPDHDLHDVGVHRRAAARRGRHARRPRRHHPLDRLRPAGAPSGRRPTEQRVVEPGKVITGAGVSAGIDLALTLVGLIHGPTRSPRPSSWGSSTTPSRPTTPVRPRRLRPRSCELVVVGHVGQRGRRPGVSSAELVVDVEVGAAPVCATTSRPIIPLRRMVGPAVGVDQARMARLTGQRHPDARRRPGR